jgi:hypothetical protein
MSCRGWRKLMAKLNINGMVRDAPVEADRGAISLH